MLCLKPGRYEKNHQEMVKESLERKCDKLYWHAQDLIGYASIIIGGIVGTVASYNFISENPEAVGAGAMLTALIFCVAASKYCNYCGNRPKL
jgi:hypothetical protein